MNSPDIAGNMPQTVRSTLRLGWLLVITVVVIKLWPYWSAAASRLPADTSGPARLIALLIASILLLFAPILIGQLTCAVCLVLLARRLGWARWLFVLGAVVSTMVTISATVSKAGLVPAASLYAQIFFLVLAVVVVALLFRHEPDHWFRSKPRLRVANDRRLGGKP